MKACLPTRCRCFDSCTSVLRFSPSIFRRLSPSIIRMFNISACGVCASPSAGSLPVVSVAGLPVLDLLLPVLFLSANSDHVVWLGSAANVVVFLPPDVAFFCVPPPPVLLRSYCSLSESGRFCCDVVQNRNSRIARFVLPRLAFTRYRLPITCKLLVTINIEIHVSLCFHRSDGSSGACLPLYGVRRVQRSIVR